MSSLRIIESLEQALLTEPYTPKTHEASGKGSGYGHREAEREVPPARGEDNQRDTGGKEDVECPYCSPAPLFRGAHPAMRRIGTWPRRFIAPQNTRRQPASGSRLMRYIVLYRALGVGIAPPSWP